ncbi:hypothetical protein TSTA_086120 [Talaromyces stipitatus ATCC 10500]|uniref:Chromo domain-containing protein n=1 Tax=Talaromyces stipitatus (strain ATCC 10500 / CBS 375.48 / QM 6759 / NRRL 1006) TaxID=441959 RepID=B8M203_TALSN|nr:uncharacterized protein TSTA_086120 [Talaromyces stipitatus ATCC 10500]EED21381.1 hypothetical protein TSTA_086120 [Talaromyces stipitatus ATCC 10500]
MHTNWRLIGRTISELQVNRNLKWVSWIGYDPDPKWYPTGYLENAPLALRAFHEQYSNKPGSPVRLDIWLKVAKEGGFVEDHKEDRVPATNA